jgi:hypothetical protein
MLISQWLIDAVSKESGQSTTEISKRFGTGAFGQKTIVPDDYIGLTKALIQQWHEKEENDWDLTLPCRGPPAEPSQKQVKRGFCATDASHKQAKDDANKLWIDTLVGIGVFKTRPIFFLDAFTQEQGFNMRTTSALKDAGFEQLFLANPDEGICKAAVAKGVSAFQGSWVEAAMAWKHLRFGGFFLDLCSGDWNYLLQQVEIALPLAAAPCALAITLLPRCCNGTSSLERCVRLGDYLRKSGWIPAKGSHDLWGSMIGYKSGSGMQIYTQVWICT